jgi:hypothetical protein
MLLRLLAALIGGAIVAAIAYVAYVAVVYGFAAANGQPWKSPGLWLYIIPGLGFGEGFFRTYEHYDALRARLSGAAAAR